MVLEGDKLDFLSNLDDLLGIFKEMRKLLLLSERSSKFFILILE